jgi:hypothetical protein
MPIERARGPHACAAYKATLRFVRASAAGDFTQLDMITALCRVVGDMVAGAGADERDAMIELCRRIITEQCEREDRRKATT